MPASLFVFPLRHLAVANLGDAVTSPDLPTSFLPKLGSQNHGSVLKGLVNRIFLWPGTSVCQLVCLRVCRLPCPLAPLCMY